MLRDEKRQASSLTVRCRRIQKPAQRPDSQTKYRLPHQSSRARPRRYRRKDGSVLQPQRQDYHHPRRNKPTSNMLVPSSNQSYCACARRWLQYRYLARSESKRGRLCPGVPLWSAAFDIPNCRCERSHVASFIDVLIEGRIGQSGCAGILATRRVGDGRISQDQRRGEQRNPRRPMR